jgi:hypothetical protein
VWKAPAASRTATVEAAGAGKYAGRKIYFDFSHWQSDGKGKSSVDWDALAKHPRFGGAYVKLGEPGVRGMAADLESDAWMDDCFDQNIDGLYRNRLWIGAYTFLNLGWPLDRDFDQPRFDKLHERGTKSEDEYAASLLTDLNIYITVRKVMQNAGRDIKPAKLRTLKAKPIDKVILDVEDIHRNNGDLIGDGWMARTYSGCVNGLVWLADHGYLGGLTSADFWNYGSRWVIDGYGPFYLDNALATRPSICAGYYWNSTVKHTTFDELLWKYLAQIPNAWTPLLFGMPVMYQVADSFTLPEVGGGKSAVDVNVLNMTDEEFDLLNPKWVARRAAVVVPPVVVPDPVYKEGTVTAAAGVRLREGINGTQRGVLPKGFVVDVLETKKSGNETWIRVARGLWMCARQGSTSLVELR